MNEPHRPFSMHPLVQLTLVRFREFIREPEAVFWVFIFPVLMAAGLGVAFRNQPVEVPRIGASDSKLAAALSTGKSLAVQLYDRDSGDQALRIGKIVLMAHPGPDGSVLFKYDDTNPEARTARLLADRALQRSAGLRDPIPSSDSLVREPGSRYIDFLIPGLLGMNLMGNGIWSIGFAIVDARRKKLLKRLVASPMSRVHYLLSFLFSRLAVLLAEVVLLVGFGVGVFGVPLRAPLWELSLLCLLPALMFSALGLLIASRVRTIEGASGLMNFVMLPMWIFSGVFFSAERFPAFAQPLIRLLPLTATVDALRANMLHGSHLRQLPAELVVITGWMVISFVLALKLFRWR